VTRKAKPQQTWVQIDEYLKQAEKLTGSKQLAIKLDLEPELESGKRKSQRRDIATGVREELEPSFWRDHLIDISIGSVTIYRCKSGDKDDPQRWAFHAHHHDDLVSGHVYFVSADAAAPASPVRRKRAGNGPRLLSKEEEEKTKAEYNRLLDKDQRRYRPQQAAAKHLAVHFFIRSNVRKR
jgi:hypothetical protein